MYILSNRLKVFSISLIIIGSLGWFYSYSTSHLTLDQVKELLAEEQHHGSHPDTNHSMETSNEKHHNSDVHHQGDHNEQLKMYMDMRMSMLNMYCIKFTIGHMLLCT